MKGSFHIAVRLRVGFVAVASLSTALAANKMNRSWQVIYRKIYGNSRRALPAYPNKRKGSLPTLMESSLQIR